MYYTDTQGREWDLSMTVGSVTDLAKFYRTDADAVLQEKVTEVMIRGSYIDLCTLFWGILKDQAKAQKVTQEEFMKFSPEEWEELAKCLEGAILAFTRPGQRAALEATVSKVRDLEEKATDKAIETLNDPETEKALMDRVEMTMRNHLSQAE